VVAAPSEATHLQRLQRLTQVPVPGAAPARRRGSAWQRPRRQLEQEVRQEVLAFRQWTAAQGLNRIESATRLGMAPRTIRLWEEADPGAAAAVAGRGRPVRRSPRPQRSAVLAFLESVGPGVGLAVLQGHFPDLPRAELQDLLWRYRRVWVARHHQVLHVLRWQCPGSVWAIDYAEPPQPLEEGFTDLLAVRDLASGLQLLWLPVPAATAATTVAALEMLFALYGAPLVLKLDNGAAFVAAVTQELVAAWQVVPLYSPPGLPAYNGAIEAGIGALKVRTHYQAVRQGRPGEWTCADTEAARQQANELGRPWGARGPTPAQRWAQRRPLTAAEREVFQTTLQRLEEPVAPGPAAGDPAAAVVVPAAAVPAADRAYPAAAPSEVPADDPDRAKPATGAAPPVGPARRPLAAEAPAHARHAPPVGAAKYREAVGRALVAHGYLLFRRRRIPLPIKRKKVA
jgi:hypothetical protein